MKILLFLFLLGFGQWTHAQDRCGTTQFNETASLLEEDESKAQFEDWLKTRINLKQARSRQFDLLSTVVYEIPVVVHVVHNGESLGTNGNIPDAQILNQIETLNEDFRRLNDDASDTPTDFLPVAADVNIEFVLAKRDSEGLPTTGIVRVKGNQSNYTLSEAEALAANSYWPAEEYFNIWVADLRGDLLGFAKFPISNEPGMDVEPNLNRLIDGVYVDYAYFGTAHNADSFSKGRTMTHETGHWLGLRHVWGDGGCGVDDYCADTPAQSSSTSGCPDVGDAFSCSSNDMFQNYMDYTDDVCMNLFTKEQSDRMRVVLESSPRRKELLSSLGGIAPVLVDNDLGVRAIISPTFGNCNATIVPSVEVRNYGTNDITSFNLEVLVDEAVIETKLVTDVLTQGQSTVVSFSSYTLTSDVLEVSYKVAQVNAMTDANVENDCKWVKVFLPVSTTIPFLEEFTNEELAAVPNWKLSNNKTETPAWTYEEAPKLIATNVAATLNYFGSTDDHFGEQDYLISPVFDLSNVTAADFKFKYAYASLSGNQTDALTVVVSTDCGATFPKDNIIFQEIGADLATVSQSATTYVPSGPGDWVTVEESMSQFLGEEVVIAFIGNNGGGNQIYVDDIELYSVAVNDYDIAIVETVGPPVVSCSGDVTINVEIKNFGEYEVNIFEIAYQIGDQGEQMTIDDVLIPSGLSGVVSLDISDVDQGSHELTVSVSRPNGVLDQDPSNNFTVAYFDVDDFSEEIPLRERFTKLLESSDWHFVRSDAPADWVMSEFRVDNVSNYAPTVRGYELTNLGVENWMVSPVLDFSNTDAASMTFDVSYANKTGRNEQLEVWGSVDCGETYTIELYNKKGGNLAVKPSDTEWVPKDSLDWRNEFLALEELVGFSEVRLAFVVTNENGNNLYLDNIELYVSDEEEQLEITETMRAFPNPASDYINVKFNFNIKEEVLIRLVSLDGEIITEESFPNTINQTYRLNRLPVTNNGMYLLQVLGRYTNLSSKVYIRK
ncbi:choice-of-anchor J domain-containing protein [Reichenbachiella carrageenanivorans]|uniref:Choice-of-anchor J domain-containing protein n=1 Tax=Reichenbachiella carrageenanivorans TaxID=2979869 RepID=A0ABY6CXX4_9BACT|nr:choice-of-anchor J domain-containing protein [Reichenbachiella carrageenanivorans]UXX78760.1 choice-of-anchor J domain-containing protein [Reichenbachiella carrageenanivorans]